MRREEKQNSGAPELGRSGPGALTEICQLRKQVSALESLGNLQSDQPAGHTHGADTTESPRDRKSLPDLFSPAPHLDSLTSRDSPPFIRMPRLTLLSHPAQLGAKVLILGRLQCEQIRRSQSLARRQRQGMDSFWAVRKDIFLYIPRMKRQGNHPLQGRALTLLSWGEVSKFGTRMGEFL